MPLEELLAHLDAGCALRAGAEAMALMGHYSCEARKILPKLNSGYHEQQEIGA